MNTRKTARVLLCLNLLSLPWAISSQAVTITWTNLSGGNWSAAANWSPNQVPASSDSALITANGTYTVTLDISPSVSSLTLGAATGQQSLSTAGQNLTLVQAGAVGTNGIIELNGGGLFGSLTVSGQLNWTSGQLGGGSTGLAVATNGVLTLAGLLGTDYVLGEFLTNAGTINLQSGNLEIDYCGSDYGQLINLPGALVYLQSDVSIDVGCLGQGTVLKSAGTGTSGLNCIFNNTGALNVASGAILMAGGGNLNGNGAVANGAQLNFGGGNFGGNGLDVSEAVGGQINVFGGTVSLAPSSPLPSLVLTNGTLTLNGTVTNLLLGGGTLTGNTTIAGTLTWTNGMLGNANTALTVSSNALLELAGVNGTDYALGEYLDNYGTVELRSGNLLLYWNDWGAVNNYPGGLLNIAADVSIDNSDNGPGIMNQGTVLKSGGTGVTSINSYFNNTGNLEVASGTVILADGGTLNGGGTVASGARLSFGGGNFGGTAFNLTNATGAAVDFSGATLQAVNLSGDGAFSFNSGTLTLNPSAPLPDLVLTNGTLTLNGTVTNVLLGGGTLLGNTTIAGTMTWTNGVLGNSSAALTVLSNAVLVLAGVDGTDYTLGEYLNNYGTVDLQSGNLLLYWNAWGSVNNFPGALLNIEADVSIDDSDNGPGLVNQGTVLKSAATGVTSINCVFNNTGVLDVASGTVVLNNGGTLNGDGLVASGAQLIFAAGNFGGTVFNLTNAPGALVEVNGANLQAVNVTGSGDFSFNSGSLTLNPSTPLPSLVLTNGNLTLNGTVTNVLLGGGTLLGNTTIAGTMTWTNGVLGNTSAALTVLSNAVLVLAGVDGTDYTLGEYLNNYGTVDLQSGNLLLFWNAWGSVNNFPGALLNIEADVSIDDSDNGPGLVNHGTVLKSGGTGVSSINGAFVNTGTLSVQTGTVDLTAACTLTGGTLQFGFNSLTNFGKINLSGTAGLTGTLIANLNDGYIPPVNTSFTVLTFSSFNGAFTNAYSESGAIWQTNYTANSVFLVDVGQILWAPPADITYGAPLGAGQLDASTSPSLAGSFSYTPVAGTVLNSGPGQTLATLFSPSDPSYIPSSLQVPLTVLQAPLDITATNQSKTYGQNISFAGTEFLAGGLVNGDTVTSATIASAGAISNAPVSGSPYAITITNVLGDAGLTNYIITYTKGALAVNPAPLGITADSLSKTYGSNVVFAGTEFISTPLQNAESIARVMLVSAGAISNAPVSGSPYSITPTALAVGSFSPGNYAITYTPAAAAGADPADPGGPEALVRFQAERAREWFQRGLQRVRERRNGCGDKWRAEFQHTGDGHQRSGQLQPRAVAGNAQRGQLCLWPFYRG